MLVRLPPDERWSLDFVSDQLSDGARLRVLAIVRATSPPYSPSTRRRSSNSFLSISPRAKRSLRMSRGVRPGGV